MVAVLRGSRYAHIGWKFLDAVSCLLMIPAQHVMALTISRFIPTSHDKQSIIYIFIRYVIVCPLMILLSLLLLPFLLLGYTIFMIINALADVQPFVYACPSGETLPCGKKFSNKMTVCSANVCISPEHMTRFNNQRSVYWRSGKIGKKLLNQDSSLNKPNLPPISRKEVILTELPDVDVIMLQEVFERIFGYQMYKLLKDKYPHCLYDVGYHTFLGNHGVFGSGLFIASKYPIMKAVFQPFSFSVGYARLVNYGILVTKLDLGVVKKDGKTLHAVGYFADTHTQAYQGKEKVVETQLHEAEVVVKKFISQTKLEGELVVCTVLGGDFNSDNMSPGDETIQNSPMWENYDDPCRECAGEDKLWTIGTELRQAKMNHPFVQDPHEFCRILLDDVQRRYFILDADVQEHTFELMTCPPKPDSNGHVTATKWGGKRRIDYLLCHKENLLSPTGFWFSTVMAGLTDHIPVVLLLEYSKEHNNQRSPNVTPEATAHHNKLTPVSDRDVAG